MFRRIAVDPPKVHRVVESINTVGTGAKEKVMRLCTNRSKCGRWLAVGSGLFGRLGNRPGSGRGGLAPGKQRRRRTERSRTSGRPRPPLQTTPVRSAPTPSSWISITTRPPAQTYGRLSQLLERTGAPAEQRAEVAQRLAVLDLLAGDREATARDLQAYSAAGGKDLALPPARIAAPPNYIEIPGPLRSFARMAALSPDVNPRRSVARPVAQHRHQRLPGDHRQ